VATARGGRPEPPSSLTDPQRVGEEELEEAPSPLEHAAPDAELADAQIALGRAEADAGVGGGLDEEELEGDLDEEEFVAEEDVADTAEGTIASPRSRRSRGAELDRHSSSVEGHGTPGNRLITFLQGSWRELQRVQWPDRRQVMQATGVVIGFVIVAGLYLGLADTVASRIVNLILK
jgi:preprotein translocase SecE subunit